MGDMGIGKRIVAIRGIGTGWNTVLWFGGLVSLLAGLMLDCSEFSGTLVSPVLYVMSVAGFGTWLIRRTLEVEDGV